MIEKILTLFTRTFSLWVVVFGMLAFFFPGPFVALKPGMQTFFALTMFGIGAVLEAQDFKRIARHPWIVAVGCCAQFTIMPLGAFALAKVLHFSDELAVGLILTGSAPGAMASNVMCYIAKADTAYSVSLTTVSTLLCPLLTPGLTLLLAHSRMEIPFWGMFINVLYTVVVPLLAGFAVRHFLKRHVERILFVFPALSAAFIIFICSLVIALNRDYLAQLTGVILAGGLLLNLYGLAGGYGVAALFRMNTSRRRTLAIEVGMQNAGLGVVLALTHFGKQAATPAAIFVFICIITASLISAWWQNRDLRSGRNASPA